MVIDVKCGDCTLMTTIEEARQLGEMLARVGHQFGVRTSVAITDMHQPLGRMVGNAVEVHEAIDVLSGSGPSDVGN